MGDQNLFSYIFKHPYSGYVLLILTIVYLLNQVDRYLYSGSIAKPPFVTSDQQSLITGPYFTLTYTITGVLISYFGSQWNRKYVLAISLLFWSAMTFMTGFAKKFWQVAVFRIGQSIGEAGCTPFAAGIISDLFPASTKGAAMSIYNVGIYTGFSLSQSAGNQIESHIDWNAAYFIFGGIGFGVVLLLLFTVKTSATRSRPAASSSSVSSTVAELDQKAASYKEIFWHWVKSPSLILFCIAGGCRNAGGYVWAYNVADFFKKYRHVSNNTYSGYMSVIPLIGGSLGAIVGGLVSDKLLKRKFADGTTLGPRARVAVVVVSNLLAAPFGVGALMLTPASPWAFLCLIGTNAIGEMWIGVTIALIFDLTPKNMHTSSVAIYLFIITNIGGNMPAAVAPLQKYFGGPDALRSALLVLYPGVYAASSFLFLFALIFLNRDITAAQKESETKQSLLADYQGESRAEKGDF